MKPIYKRPLKAADENREDILADFGHGDLETTDKYNEEFGTRFPSPLTLAQLQELRRHLNGGK